MKKSLLLLLMIPFVLGACNEQSHDSDENNATQSGGQNTQESGGGGSGENQETGGGSEKEELLQEYTHTFDFNNDPLFRNNFTNASGFGDSKANLDKLKTYFDDGLEYYYLIDNLELEGYACPRKRTDDSKFYIQLGSKNSGGCFTWKSTVKIYRVEAEVINYTNGGYSVDSNAKFYIDDKKTDLTVEEGITPQKTLAFKDYMDGTNKFEISNADGRVLLSKLTITWRG